MRARSRLGAALFVAATVAIGVAAWMWWTASRAPRRVDLQGANVLLVTIDTLRADRLGTYGNRSRLTPTLDAIATSGVRFTRAWSHAPMTLPSHASILTGLLPPRHGARNNGAFRLGPEPATLAERLHAAGYRTGAFIGAFVLDARFGLNRGFDEYDDRYDSARSTTSFHFVERSADRVLRAATDWIARSDTDARRPWFAWIHLFDPHAPYQAPADIARSHAPYDAEVAWTDSALGTALDTLRRLGHLDQTLIVITADHGESLGDHGETTHGLFAYEATLRVPLILSAPGLHPASVTAAARHVDILPTILDLVGLESPAHLDGHSLRAAIEGSESTAEPPIYFEALDANLTRGWAPLTGVVSGMWKYIDLPEPELYDLEHDPDERTNLVDRDSERVGRLQDQLRQARAARTLSSGAAVDSTTAARLQSLGYVSGSARVRVHYDSADDPKRLIRMSEMFNSALDDYSEGRADLAIEQFNKILGDRPDFLAARLSAATALIGTGRAVDAVRLLRKAPADDQTDPVWLTKLGQALAATGELHEARAALESAVEATRGDSEPLNELGVVLLRLGQVNDARRAFERLLTTDATAVGTWYNVGLLELGARRPVEAAAAFDRVVQIDPRHADGWRGLGAALATHDKARAIEAWRRVIELEPEDFDTLYNLGMVLAESGRPAEAVPHLRRFLATAPRDRYGKDLPHVRAVLARLDPSS